LIPNPILKVLSTLSCHMVRHLLIGGQACVLYGAAEFSRDCDVVILVNEEKTSTHWSWKGGSPIPLAATTDRVSDGKPGGF
jgi:hypothetical protein